ncbi:MAG: NAD-dependent epimerase/dehydratase family protein [Actinomycetota bacterium]
MATHTIVGAGAVGSGTAKALVERGEQVRMVTRSGSGHEHPAIERVAADATDRSRMVELAADCVAIYNCANPPYHKWASDWPPLAESFLATAEETGARLVTMSNLYGYAEDSSPMRATDPLDPPTRKGAIRAGMWRDALAAHDAGRIQATEVRASDYFGPGLGDTAHLGDRFVPRVMKGKSPQVLGAPDVKHSWTYIDDVCEMMAIAGTDDRAPGRPWHVPTVEARTVDEMAAAIAVEAGVSTPVVKRIPTALIKVAGVVVPMMRELPEMLYQFEKPFVIDATDTSDVFGFEATPLEQQVKATVAAYR